MALRNTKPAAAAPKPRTGAKPAKRLDAYLAAIAAVIGLSAIVSQLVDYQFKIIASQSFTDERDLAGFFGHFYAATGVASLLVQFFLTSTILSRFGLLAGLLALPVSLNFGTLAILFNPQLWSGVFAKFSDQTFKFTLANSSMELLWLPVRPDRRKVARPLISGTIKSICEVAAGLLMFVLVKLFAPRYLGIVSLIAIAIWIVVIIRLKSLYVKTLITAIEKRQIDFEGLNLDAQDPAMIAVIEKALRSEDEGQRFSGLELLEGLPLRPWEGTLKTLFEEGSPEIRNRLLALAAEDEKVLPDDRIVRAIGEDPAVAAGAMRLAGSRKIRAAVPRLVEQLDSRDPQHSGGGGDRHCADRRGARRPGASNPDRHAGRCCGRGSSRGTELRRRFTRACFHCPSSAPFGRFSSYRSSHRDQADRCSSRDFAAPPAGVESRGYEAGVLGAQDSDRFSGRRRIARTFASPRNALIWRRRHWSAPWEIPTATAALKCSCAI